MFGQILLIVLLAIFVVWRYGSWFYFRFLESKRARGLRMYRIALRILLDNPQWASDMKKEILSVNRVLELLYFDEKPKEGSKDQVAYGTFLRKLKKMDEPQST